MIKPIRKMGDPCLLKISDHITKEEFGSQNLFDILADMEDTMRHLGGVGIAAPQIGINKQVVIIEYYQKDITRYQNIGDCPRKVIINPIIEAITEEEESFSEGCLSVPGLRGTVSRPKAINYQYFDEYGNLHKGTEDSFFARVMQHECDHLQGVLYPMRMKDMSTLAFIDLD
jgi:peptide deformylase